MSLLGLLTIPAADPAGLVPDVSSDAGSVVLAADDSGDSATSDVGASALADAAGTVGVYAAACRRARCRYRRASWPSRPASRCCRRASRRSRSRGRWCFCSSARPRPSRWRSGGRVAEPLLTPEKILNTLRHGNYEIAASAAPPFSPLPTTFQGPIRDAFSAWDSLRSSPSAAAEYNNKSLYGNVLRRLFSDGGGRNLAPRASGGLAWRRHRRRQPVRGGEMMGNVPDCIVYKLLS